jgi:hypothetical protein
MIFYALKKLRPHIVKDMRRIPEQELKDGMGKIARAVVAAIDGPPELTVLPPAADAVASGDNLG